MRRAVPALLLLAALGGGSAGAASEPTGASAGARTRLALLPPENVSGVTAAPPAVEELLATLAARQGWTVVRGEAVDRALHAARIWRLDSFSTTALRALGEELGASAVLISTVDTWLDGENALFAASASLRAVDGTTLWSRFFSLSGSETAGALSFHRAADVAEVARRAFERAGAGFPSPGAAAPPARYPGSRWSLARPPTFRAASLAAEPGVRLCIIPFANSTDDRAAPRIVADLLSRRLAESDRFTVVEPAELRAALLAEKVPAIRNLDPPRLRQIGARLGTTYFLRGTVWRWREGSPRTDRVSPEVELQLELVDVASQRVLWTAHHRRRGDDYEGLFLRGRVSNVAALADRVLAEMLQAERNSKGTKGSSR